MRRFWAIVLVALMCVGVFAGALGLFLDDGDDDEAVKQPSAAYTTREQIYANSHPNLTSEEVKDQVWLGLDQELYTDADTVDDPDSVTVYVNRHWKLPDDYVPDDLTDLNGFEGMRLRREAAEAFEQLCQDSGIPVVVKTAYLDASGTQQINDELAAEQGRSVADQVLFPAGYSDYQTGLALDVALDEDQADLNAVTESEHYAAFVKAAREHGFIQPYLEKNSQLSQTAARPYHFRYVGKEAAAQMGNMDFDTYTSLKKR